MWGCVSLFFLHTHTHAGTRASARTAHTDKLATHSARTPTHTSKTHFAAKAFTKRLYYPACVYVCL